MHADFDQYEQRMAKEAEAIERQRREQMLMQALMRRFQGMQQQMQGGAPQQPQQPGMMPQGMPPFGGPPRA
jgi:hypothetical protein